MIAIGFVFFINQVAFAVAPTVTFQKYYDSNSDGAVDQIKLTVSATITTCTATVADFTYTGNDIGGSLTGGSLSCATNIVTINFGTPGNANTTGHSTAPTIAYTDDVSRSISSSGGELATFTDKTLQDLASPVAAAISMQDNTGDGKVDRVVITYSEALANVSAGTNGFSVTGGGTLQHGTCYSPSADPDGTATLTVTFTCSAVYTAVGSLSVAFTTGFTIKDSSANYVASATYNATSSPAITDGAAPAYVSSQTLDNDNNTTVDYIAVTYSEPISDASVAATDFEAGIAATTAANLIETFASLTPSSGNVTDTANDATVYIGVASSGETISALTTNYTLKIEQVGAITDGTNTLLTTAATSTDGAKPQISIFTYLDYDTDGKIDKFTLTFTETVTSSSVLKANDLTLTNVGDFTGAAFGTSATDLILTSVSSVTVSLGTEATAVDTKENSGTIAISSQNTFSLTDGTNTNSTLGAQTIATFTDGAAPAYVSSQTLDNDNNGTVDYVSVTYSEAVSDASVDATDFMTGISSLAAGNLTEAFASLTPSTGNVADTANDATIYIGVTSGTETISTLKTDYTLRIQQVGAITDRTIYGKHSSRLHSDFRRFISKMERQFI